jgi:hypothetical protein
LRVKLTVGKFLDGDMWYKSNVTGKDADYNDMVWYVKTANDDGYATINEAAKLPIATVDMTNMIDLF